MKCEHDAFFSVKCLNVEAWFNQLFLDFPLLFYCIVVPVGINWSSKYRGKYLSALFVANFTFVDLVMFHFSTCK